MTKEHAFMPCPLEKHFLGVGYTLVHDGQRLSAEESKKVQFILPPGEVRYFTHKLEKVVDGKIVGKARFEYDLRSWFFEEPILVDFDFWEIGAGGKKGSQKMALAKERIR